MLKRELSRGLTHPCAPLYGGVQPSLRQVAMSWKEAPRWSAVGSSGTDGLGKNDMLLERCRSYEPADTWAMKAYRRTVSDGVFRP